MADIAYGFVDLQDLFSQRVAEVPNGYALVSTAIEESTREYSRVVDGMLSTFATDVTVAKEHYLEPVGGTLQPLDEFGNPLPVQGRRGYDVAYPIQGAGTAFGTNRLSRAMMTVAEANQRTVDAQNRDRDWLKRHILAAILTSSPYNWFDQTLEQIGIRGMGNLTVMPLANGDSSVYVGRGGRVLTNHSHYMAQSDDISDAANPFGAIWENLMEHPSNQGKRLIVYVADNLASQIASLTGFIPPRDSDVSLGSIYSEVANAPDVGFGDVYLGYVMAPGRAHIISWGELPDGYMIATVEGVPFLGRRQYPVASLQGFFTENHSPDGNVFETRMIRYCGFGVRNRVGAVAFQVGAANYTTPAEYQAPLAV
ncbi:hypothetical protein [Rubrobacter calidifluminis]|uniref:hypothetical protein n=1 Tax=Rubrobacter calidifluminis TaxID=1392640 RepID=UPI00235EAA65|nr:hypothetical protein [Rubrobacter calidifluminis]